SPIRQFHIRTMRYLTFSSSENRAPRVGIVQGERIVDLSAMASGGLLDLIRAGPELWRRVAATTPTGTGYQLADIRWHAPIPRPAKNVVCRRRNYLSHITEVASAP